MALTEGQTVDLAKLIGLSYVATLQALPVVTATLSSAAVTAIETDLGGLITEFTRIENKHLRMHGGRDGIDLDYDRNRRSLRERALTLLGLPVQRTSNVTTSGQVGVVW